MKADDKKEGFCLVQQAVHGIHFIRRHLEYACFIAIKKKSNTVFEFPYSHWI